MRSKANPTSVRQAASERRRTAVPATAGGLAVLVLAAILAGSCAGGPQPADPAAASEEARRAAPAHPGAPATPGPAAQPESADPVSVATLYADLQAQIEAYENGLRMSLESRDDLAAAQLAAAAARIRAGADACALQADCELDLFLAAYDTLLAEQGAALAHLGQRSSESPAAEEEVMEEPGVEPFHGHLPRRGSVNLLKGNQLAELIELNGPVLAAIDDWLTWMRPNFHAAWFNYQFLRPQMAPIYEQAGLPEALLFGMLAAESGGKVHAYSSAGAAGPLQFMRGTGRAYGLVERDGFDLRFDPASATRANVAYLTRYLTAFGDSLEKVLAAYNGGEARMGRVQRSYGETPFWDKRVYYQFPRETRQYVPRVLAAAWLFLHPEDYGLELPEIDSATVALRLETAMAVDELAICLGEAAGHPDGWFRTLRNLNPPLDPGERVAAGDEIVFPRFLVAAYEERCRDPERLAAIRRMHDANYPEEPEMIPYTVRRGDSLAGIAARFPCASVGELAAVNRISAPRYLIREGQRLQIPTCG